mmetsp:Transcript_14582/g.29176  ORF Transcript_14582/g.29176 Transcript_14582/m.29176 type:complete len:200 (-) Transcript_14582:100-699(-)
MPRLFSQFEEVLAKALQGNTMSLIVNAAIQKNSSQESTSTEEIPEIAEEPVVETEVPCSAIGEPKFDVGQQVYGVVKSLWGHGKGINLVKHILGAVEDVANTLPIDFAYIDESTKPKLKELDNFLNPNIMKIVEFVTPALKKTEEIIRPFVAKFAPIILPSLGISLPPPGLCESSDKSGAESKSEEFVNPDSGVAYCAK